MPAGASGEYWVRSAHKWPIRQMLIFGSYLAGNNYRSVMFYSPQMGCQSTGLLSPIRFRHTHVDPHGERHLESQLSFPRKQHNTVAQPGLKPRPVNPQLSALTTRPWQPTLVSVNKSLYLLFLFSLKWMMMMLSKCIRSRQEADKILFQI